MAQRVLLSALVVGIVATSCTYDGGDDSAPQTENAPLVSERLEDALLWTAEDGSVELAVQILPAAPVAGREVVAVLEAVDRRGGLANMAIVWGDEPDGPAPIPGSVIVDCTADAEIPTRDTPDARERRRETHIFAEPGSYTITVVATGAGCGYSNSALVQETLTVALEVDLLEEGAVSG